MKLEGANWLRQVLSYKGGNFEQNKKEITCCTELIQLNTKWSHEKQINSHKLFTFRRKLGTHYTDMYIQV